MTNIKPNVLDAFVQRPDANIAAFLSFGNDNGLVYETAMKVAKAINPNLDDPFDVVYMTAEQIKSDPVSILMNAGTNSLMGGRRLVIIKNAADTVTAAMKEFLTENTGGFVVLFGADLNNNSSLVKLMNSADNALALGCYADDRNALVQLINTTFSSEGIKLENGVVDFLVSKLGADRKLTRSELDKLITYLGEGKLLTLDIAMMCIDDASASSRDDLVEAIFMRNPKMMAVALKKLLSEGETEVSVIRAVSAFLRKMLPATEIYDKSGNVINALAAIKPKLFFKQEARVKPCIPKWKADAIQKALNVLVQAEVGCKTTEYPPLLICERAFLQICTIR